VNEVYSKVAVSQYVGKQEYKLKTTFVLYELCVGDNTLFKNMGKKTTTAKHV